MQASDITKNIARTRHEAELGSFHTLYIKGDIYNEHCFATLFRLLRTHIFEQPDYLNEVFYLLDVSSNWFNHRALIADLQDLFGGYFMITMHLSGYKKYKWIKIVARNNPPHWSIIWGGLYLMLTILREVDSRWLMLVWKFRNDPGPNNPQKFTTWQSTMCEFTTRHPPYDVYDKFYGRYGAALDTYIKTYLKNIKLIWGTKRKWDKDSVIKMNSRSWTGVYQTVVYNSFVDLAKNN